MIYPVFAQTNDSPNGSGTIKTTENTVAVTTQAGTEQPAQASGGQPGGMKEGIMGMAPFIIIVVVMFYLMYRSQKKEQKRRQEMIDSTKKGDTVLTIGGIYGEIAEIHEDRFILKVADGVKLAVAKTAVASIPGKSEQEKAEKK